MTIQMQDKYKCTTCTSIITKVPIFKIHTHACVYKVNVTQVVNTCCKAKGYDKLYTGQTDKKNYKIHFSPVTSGRHRGGEEVYFHSNLSTG
jgi:hypothetical protein